MNEIEQKFADGVEEWLRMYAKKYLEYDYPYLDFGSDYFNEVLYKATLLIAKSQYQIGSYRIDFAFINNEIDMQYAVEIDGHDYHKTKEQRFHDYVRERYLQKNGFTVVRFMGSEVAFNPKGCFENFMDIVYCDAKRFSKISAIYRLLGKVEVSEDAANRFIQQRDWENKMYEYEPYILDQHFSKLKKILNHASSKEFLEWLKEIENYGRC